MKTIKARIKPEPEISLRDTLESLKTHCMARGNCSACEIRYFCQTRPEHWDIDKAIKSIKEAHV